MNLKRILWIVAAIFLVSETANAALVLTLDDPSTSVVDLRIVDQGPNDTVLLPDIVSGPSITIGGVPVYTVIGSSKPGKGSVSWPVLMLDFRSGTSTGGGQLSISLTDTDYNADFPYRASVSGGTGGTLQFDFFGDSNNQEFGKSFDIGSTAILTKLFSPQIFQSAANQVGSLTIAADIGFTSSLQAAVFQSKIEVQIEDVPPGYWAKDAIYKIYEAGITTGCSDDPMLFCPENTVNRDQIAVFLGRATRDSNFTPPDATGIFADVPKSYWAADWIEQFYTDGLTKGCKIDPDNMQSPVMYYCPKDPVTRATMAIFLLRAKYGKNYTPPMATGIFSDVPITYWAADWIEQLYKEGITTGCQKNPLRYCPESLVTRAQMAVFLYRTFEL